MLRVVIVLPFDPEIEEEALLDRGAVGGRVEQVDRTGVAHGHARAAHRPRNEGTLRIELPDTVHRIGRECIDAARLGRRDDGNSRHGRDEKLK